MHGVHHMAPDIIQNGNLVQHITTSQGLVGLVQANIALGPPVCSQWLENKWLFTLRCKLEMFTETHNLIENLMGNILFSLLHLVHLGRLTYLLFFLFSKRNNFRSYIPSAHMAYVWCFCLDMYGFWAFMILSLSYLRSEKWT